jgi:hypothetical protein
LLDTLPPEQREFALEVLAKFEPKPESEPAKAQKKELQQTGPLQEIVAVVVPALRRFLRATGSTLQPPA